MIIATLVYEKQQKLRIMMKMHGLEDGAYWLITYFFFLLVSVVYMICFMIFGSLIGKPTANLLMFLCSITF